MLFNNLLRVLWSVVVPENPVGCVFKQFRCEDVCERCYRSCTVCTPKKAEKTNQADKDHDKVEGEQEALAKHHHTVVLGYQQTKHKHPMCHLCSPAVQSQSF